MFSLSLAAARRALAYGLSADPQSRADLGDW
jgi:hypothetical protein